MQQLLRLPQQLRPRRLLRQQLQQRLLRWLLLQLLPLCRRVVAGLVSML
jgi:hypothetical protein